MGGCSLAAGACTCRASAPAAPPWLQWLTLHGKGLYVNSSHAYSSRGPARHVFRRSRRHRAGGRCRRRPAHSRSSVISLQTLRFSAAPGQGHRRRAVRTSQVDDRHRDGHRPRRLRAEPGPDSRPGLTVVEATCPLVPVAHRAVRTLGSRGISRRSLSGNALTSRSVGSPRISMACDVVLDEAGRPRARGTPTYRYGAPRRHSRSRKCGSSSR